MLGKPGQEKNEACSYRNFPIEDEKRSCTDIFCTCFSFFFALTILIVSLAMFNIDNLKKMTYPNDSEGNLCGWDTVYPIVYYTTLTDPSKRLCVNQCPKKGDPELECYPNHALGCAQNDDPKYEVLIYDSEITQNRLGLFCMPTDEQKKAKVQDMYGLQSKNTFLSTYDGIWNSLWLTTIFGILLLAAIQFYPVQVFRWMILLGGITFVIGGLLAIILPKGFIVYRLIAGFAFIAFGGIVLHSLKNEGRRQAAVIGSLILQQATHVVRDSGYFILLYIPLFMLLLLGLIFLIAFQILAVWSSGNLNFDPNYPFYHIQKSWNVLLCVLVFFEFLWGMSFLKEAFNFCVSGYATKWYNEKQGPHHQSKPIGQSNINQSQYESNPDEPNESDESLKSCGSLTHSLKMLLCRHWGSVAGGSFMLFFFYPIDFITDYFFSTDVPKQRTESSESGREHLKTSSSEVRRLNKKKKSNKTRKLLEFESDQRPCSYCLGFLDLVRSEAMGYIYTTSIPYCNASRYCEMLSQDSSFYDGNQTTNRVYRLCAHGFICAIAGLICFAIFRTSEISGVIAVLVVELFTITYFISLHADLAEGILVSIFIEEFFVGTGEIKQPPQQVIDLYMQEDEIIKKQLPFKPFFLGSCVSNENHDQNQNRNNQNRNDQNRNDQNHNDDSQNFE